MDGLTRTNPSCNVTSSVQDGCLLWGSRVIVPENGREAIISFLHEGHPGVTHMQWLACGYVWWPGIDNELNFAIKTYAECQENQRVPARAPMHPWEWPDRLWATIHIDYAGLVKGKVVGLDKLFFFSSLLFYFFMLILSTYYSFDYTYYSFSHTNYSRKMKNRLLQKVQKNVQKNRLL